MLTRGFFLVCVLSLLSHSPTPRADETLEELLAAGRAALRQGEPEKALTLADRAVTKSSKSADAHLLRGLANDGLDRHAEAVQDFTRVLQIDPRSAEAFDRRGIAHFKLAHIKEALADFDAHLALRPDLKPGHWRRGIVCYYAGQFDEGRKQFEGYQNVDSNDVENAVWRYLCMARAVGVERARADLMKVGQDRRVPMMVVYQMFAGKAKPEEVLAAAEEGNPPEKDLRLRRFYAHLYLGLFYEAAGDAKKAREHLTRAAQDYRLPGFYMWDVARVHVELLGKADKK